MRYVHLIVNNNMKQSLKQAYRAGGRSTEDRSKKGDSKVMVRREFRAGAKAEPYKESQEVPVRGTDEEIDLEFERQVAETAFQIALDSGFLSEVNQDVRGEIFAQ